jgi:hypothetical protein
MGYRRTAYRILVEETLRESDHCEKVEVDGEVIFI